MTDAFAELSSQLGTMNETLAKLMRGSLTLQWVPGRADDNVPNSNAVAPDASNDSNPELSQSKRR